MSLTPTEYDRGFNDGMASGLPRSALENANATIEALTAEITKLTSQLDEARRKAIEDCARVAENYFDGSSGQIAKLIRALLSESKS